MDTTQQETAEGMFEGMHLCIDVTKKLSTKKQSNESTGKHVQ